MFLRTLGVKTAPGEYAKYHLAALKLAFSAGTTEASLAFGSEPSQTCEGPEKGTLAKRETLNAALVQEGFGVHFLQDAFASGHQASPRRTAKDHWNARYPLFWLNLRWWLAQEIAVGLAPRKKKSVRTCLVGWGPFSGAKDAVFDFAETITPITLGDLVGMAVHDYFNARGLAATSDGSQVRLAGDGALKGSAEDLLKSAIRASLFEVERAHQVGTQAQNPRKFRECLPQVIGEDKRFAASSMIPEPNRAELATLPWMGSTLEELLGAADGRFVEALELTLGTIKAELVSALSGMKDEDAKAVVRDRVVGIKLSDRQHLLTSLRGIVDYVPDLRVPADERAGAAEDSAAVAEDSATTAMEYVAEAEEAAQEAGGKEARAPLTDGQKTELVKTLSESKCKEERGMRIVGVLESCVDAQALETMLAQAHGSLQAAVDKLRSNLRKEEWTKCREVFMRKGSDALVKLSVDPPSGEKK